MKSHEPKMFKIFSFNPKQGGFAPLEGEHKRKDLPQILRDLRGKSEGLIFCVYDDQGKWHHNYPWFKSVHDASTRQLHIKTGPYGRPKFA